jgi:hypothetical protein
MQVRRGCCQSVGAGIRLMGRPLGEWRRVGRHRDRLDRRLPCARRPQARQSFDRLATATQFFFAYVIRWETKAAQARTEPSASLTLAGFGR